MSHICGFFLLRVAALRRLAVISINPIGLCLASEMAAAERRVVLVIGSSGYQNVAALTNPSNDAAVIADISTKAAFDLVAFRPT